MTPDITTAQDDRLDRNRCPTGFDRGIWNAEWDAAEAELEAERAAEAVRGCPRRLARDARRVRVWRRV